MSQGAQNTVYSLLLLAVSLFIAFAGAEGLLRLKNADMKNYDIEMWRYAKLLKQRSADPALGHTHRPDSQAMLQSVVIRTNQYGLRGAPVDEKPAPGTRRILVLGSSITLGWGVAEEQTLTALLQAKFRQAGARVEVLNAGIGNYNAPRYVHLFFSRLHTLQPTDIVVHYFIRDAEPLDPGGGNWLLRNSQLAVTLWSVWNRMQHSADTTALENHYRTIYARDSRGLQQMTQALQQLADYARARHIRLYFAITPDVHQLSRYPFADIHAQMIALAQKLGYTTVDLLPGFAGLTPQQIWAMPGDPHPNSRGHQIMADRLYPVLQQQPSHRSYPPQREGATGWKHRSLPPVEAEAIGWKNRSLPPDKGGGLGWGAT